MIHFNPMPLTPHPSRNIFHTLRRKKIINLISLSFYSGCALLICNFQNDERINRATNTWDFSSEESIKNSKGYFLGLGVKLCRPFHRPFSGLDLSGRLRVPKLWVRFHFPDILSGPFLPSLELWFNEKWFNLENDFANNLCIPTPSYSSSAGLLQTHLEVIQ